MSSTNFVPLTRQGTTPPTADPVPYNGGPWQLICADTKLMLSQLSAIKGIVLPWHIRNQDMRDELYLGSWKNIRTVVLHAILIFTQSHFLISLFFCAFSPVIWFAVYVAVFCFLNKAITFLLNGMTIQLDSQVDVENEEQHADEFWVFLNGVSVGRDWLQSNCDRLSETFGRRVHGVHNPTDGILFDLIQCLIQRNFCYATQDVRRAYKLVKTALLNEKYRKIVFILHSQGGIEGGLIVDWLLDEIPPECMARLEIYTFGNAANHFNNPHRSAKNLSEDELTGQIPRVHQAIRYIEHYANTGDFVSRYGVLSFSGVENRFMGRLFQSPQSGHLLNQHYLSQMFSLNKNRQCAETNDFMDMEVSFDRNELGGIMAQKPGKNVKPHFSDRIRVAEKAFVGDVNTPLTPLEADLKWMEAKLVRVKDLSRLWQYRNGMSPSD